MAPQELTQDGSLTKRTDCYCSVAYSSLACFKMGRSGPAFFQSAKRAS